MSFIYTNLAWQAPIGNAARKLLLLRLCDQANDEGWCWPSEQHLATHLECSMRTIRRHLHELASDGFIEIHARPGRTSYYRVFSSADPGQNGRGTPDTAMSAEPSLEPKTSLEKKDPFSNDEPSAVNGQTVVRHWIATSKARGVEPEQGAIKRLCGEIKRLASRHEEGVMLTAVEKMAEYGAAPSSLATYVTTTEQRAAGEERGEPEAKRRVSEFLAANGWPTGARFVRGTHSGCYKPDIWGTEHPDDNGEYPRPTYADLLASMEETVRQERTGNGDGRQG